MTRHWLRRALACTVAATAFVLAGCGSSTIESQLHPTRVIAFGDATADMGQTAGAIPNARYTVNDGTPNTWVAEVATRFGLPLSAAVLGGTDYATGNARVVITPDAAGNAATPTVAQQIDAFLAGNSFTATDLVLVSAGTSDVIAELNDYVHGGQTYDQMIADVGQAGRDLGTQVRRLVNAGAKQVVIVGPYDLAKSAAAVQSGRTAEASAASLRFNNQMLVSVVDLGANVLYVDAAFYWNLVTSAVTTYGLANGTDPVCTSVDPGPGIGLGNNQVNSHLCTNSTLVAGANPSTYLFADLVYMTPGANRMFGDVAYDKIHARW